MKGSRKNRIAIMKRINKDLALRLQTLKQNLAESTAQNCSLKAEIYDIIMERNSLMEEKMKLIDTLKNIADVVGATLNPRCLKRDRLGSKKKSATICPMVSGYTIHKPKVKLTRLNFNDYPRNMQDNGYVINLSTIVEEDQIKEVIKRRLGQRSGLSQSVPYSGIIDYKQPIILLERHPLFSKRHDGSSRSGDELNSEVEEKINITPKRKTTNGIESKCSSPRSPLIKTEKDLNPVSSGIEPRRKSLRIKKEVNYKYY